MSASELQPGNSDSTPSHHTDRRAHTPAITQFHVERQILGPDGHTWQVGERAGALGAFDVWMLFFVADHAMRRVRNYPANWRELSDRELYAVSLLM